jgi:hypothetical protein
MITLSKLQGWPASVIFVFLMFVQGCAVRRTYPVCFYQQTPQQDEYAQYSAATAEEMHVYLGKEAEIAFAPTHRLTSAKGSWAGQRALSRAWPLMGCVGSNLGQVNHNGFSPVCKLCATGNKKSPWRTSSRSSQRRRGHGRPVVLLLILMRGTAGFRFDGP